MLGNKEAAANIAATYQITSISSNSKTIDSKHCLAFSYDRKNDITYQNKTGYDQKVAVFVSDYIDLVEKIGDIAVEAINSINDKNKKDALSSKFNSLLAEPAKSKQRDGDARKYQDLIKGRFDLDTAFHLERNDDTDTISNKWFDLSKTTIRKLIEDGRDQTLTNLYEKEEKENDKNYAQQQLRRFIDTVDKSREDGEIESHHADFLIGLALRRRQTS